MTDLQRLWAFTALLTSLILAACGPQGLNASRPDGGGRETSAAPSEPTSNGVQPLWVYEFEGRSHSRPTEAEGVVYVGRAGLLEGGALMALDAATGDLLWEYETTGHVPSSPIILDEKVIFATLNGAVLAVDATSGREIWRHDTGARIRSSGALVDGRIVFGSYRLGGGGGELFALDANGGTPLWSLSTEGLFFESSPIIGDGLLLIGNTDGNLYAVDPVEGDVLWTFQAGDPSLRQHPLANRREVLSTPAVSGGTAFVSSNDGHVYAIRLTDQSLVWKTDIGNSEGHSAIKYSLSSPTVAGDQVFVGSNNGSVYTLETEDGAVHWQFQAESWVWSTPAESQGVVYVGSDDRHLYALEAASGELLWKYDTGLGAADREALSGIWGAPRVSSGTVYVASQNGRVHALPAAR